MKVNDYIYKTNVIPEKICKELIKQINKKEWQKHRWYDYEANDYLSEKEKELDVQPIDKEMQQIMTPYLVKAYHEYNQKFANTKETRTSNLATKFSPIRFNKYKKGTMMRMHYDHIHSLFDGNHKGIPVLSFIGVLNQNYTGGELIINDQKIDSKAGDIIIFPSCFLYPHEVKEVKKGTRYSFVSWGF
jgi:predicted 2-oxoglutarate/Fe(II)-dependent dioxygenase YbiX